MSRAEENNIEAPAVSVDRAELAIDHLGEVLDFLADLSPADRCRALDEALAFYNAARPLAQVAPHPGWVSRLVQVGPLDWPRLPPVYVVSEQSACMEQATLEAHAEFQAVFSDLPKFTPGSKS